MPKNTPEHLKTSSKTFNYLHLYQLEAQVVAVLICLFDHQQVLLDRHQIRVEKVLQWKMDPTVQNLMIWTLRATMAPHLLREVMGGALGCSRGVREIVKQRVSRFLDKSLHQDHLRVPNGLLRSNPIGHVVGASVPWMQKWKKKADGKACPVLEQNQWTKS
jgi:hypothetical protein